MMLLDFKTDHRIVLEKLNKFPKEEFMYIKALVLGAPDAGPGGIGPGVGPQVETIDVSIGNNAQLQERFIELACTFEPTIVYQFVRTHEAYHLDRMLDLCKARGIVDATAYLLERAGDVQGALNILVDCMKLNIKVLTDAMNESSNNLDVSRIPENRNNSAVLLQMCFPDTNHRAHLAFNTIDRILNMSTSMCQRNSRKSDPEAEAMWYSVLRTLFEPHHATKVAVKVAISDGRPESMMKYLNEDQDIDVTKVPRTLAPTLVFQFVIGDLMARLLRDMVISVSLTSLIQNLISSQENGAEFGELKDVMMTMVETYAYERVLMETVNRLVSRDMFESFDAFKKSRCAALEFPDLPKCMLCDQNITTPTGMGRQDLSENNSVLYACQHLYHVACLRGKLEDGCPICTAAPSKPKTAAGDAQSQAMQAQKKRQGTQGYGFGIGAPVSQQSSALQAKGFDGERERNYDSGW